MGVEIENRMKKKKKSFERLEADILENCENLAKDHENREEKWKSGIPTQGFESKSKNGSNIHAMSNSPENQEIKKRPQLEDHIESRSRRLSESSESRSRKISESGKRDRKESEPSSSSRS